MQKRQPLYRRTGNVNTELQVRDAEIIRQVHKHRFLTSEQIIALLGSSRQGILRRLKILFRAGYLDRPREQIRSYPYRVGSGPMIYGLGNKGADLLAQELKIPRTKVDWTSKNREVKWKNIDHALLTSQFMVCLELACRIYRYTELIGQDEIISGLPEAQRNSPRPGTWKINAARETKSGKKALYYTIMPDKIFKLYFPEDDPGLQYALFFLEADRSTMPIKRSNPYTSSIQRKLFGYWESYRQDKFIDVFGIRGARVLTITKSRERIGNMIRANKEVAGRGQGSKMFLFAEINEFSLKNPVRVFEKIWQNGRDDQLEDIIGS